MKHRLWGAVLLAVVAALVAYGASRYGRPLTARADAPPADAVVLRVPSLTADQSSQLDKLMRDPMLETAGVSAMVRHVPSGKVLYQHQAARLCSPASTNKLITGAAAFALLGPSYRFTTRVLADRRPDDNGVIHGNLYLVGGGDPHLTVEKVWSIAHGLRLLGVRRVTGDLVGDDSYHDNVRFYPEWGEQSFRSYHAPLGALSVNYNTISFWVRPGAKEDGAAHVELDPRPYGLRVTGGVKTAAGRGNKTVLRYANLSANISGTIGMESQPGPARQAVDDPLAFAIGSFRELLRGEGIEVGGQQRAGIAPKNTAFVYAHESEELALLMRDLFRFSNNFTAEQILKSLGAQQLGAPGSREKGAAAVTAWLRNEKLWQDGTTVIDGSGLSRDNRQSAAGMVAALDWIARQPRLFPEFLNAQPIAGVDGTLRHRFKHSPLVGRVRAKTGFINGVVSLAGYSYDTRGDLYSFAVLINDYKPSAGVRGPQKLTEKLLEIAMQ